MTRHTNSPNTVQSPSMHSLTAAAARSLNPFPLPPTPANTLSLQDGTRP